MEEKKSIKVSLKTYLISMLFMLLVIGFLLGYIMHTSKNIQEKLNTIVETMKTENVVEEVVENVMTEKTEVVEAEEETDTKEIENIVSNADNLETETELKDNKFTDEEIKTVLQGYLTIFKGHGSPAGLLNSLDLMSWRDEENYELNEDGFRETDIPYSVFEKAVKEYTTLENFEKINKGNKFIDLEIKNIDGYVAYYDSGWSGTAYEVKKVTLKGDYSDLSYIAEVYVGEGEYGQLENIEFTIEEYNGNCVISYCD